MSADWLDDEPGWAEAKRELGVIWRTARARLPLTVALAVLVTAAITGWRATRARTFEASIVLRVTEHQLEGRQRTPSDDGAFEAFVKEVVLSRSTLLAMIQKHGLHPDKMGPDPSLALEATSEDIEVRVVQNYFAPERFIADPLRTARLLIGYHGATPEEALAVVRDIGDRIAQQKLSLRRARSEAVARSASAVSSAMRQQLVEARRQQAELNLRRGDPLALVQLAGVTDIIKQVTGELVVVTEETSRLELQDQLEDGSLAMSFEIVDPGWVELPLMSRDAELVLVASLSFAFALPLAGIGVATLHGRVYRSADLRRAGVSVLASLPSVPRRRGGVA